MKTTFVINQDSVDAALDRAQENGYGWNISAVLLAHNLCDYDINFRYADMDQLISLVGNWLSRQ